LKDPKNNLLGQKTLMRKTHMVNIRIDCVAWSWDFVMFLPIWSDAAYTYKPLTQWASWILFMSYNKTKCDIHIEYVIKENIKPEQPISQRYLKVMHNKAGMVMIKLKEHCHNIFT